MAGCCLLVRYIGEMEEYRLCDCFILDNNNNYIWRSIQVQFWVCSV